MRSAVDVNFLAGDVGGLLGGQEHDGVGHLLSLAGAAHGDAGDDGVGLLLGHALPDVGVDQAGAHAVGGDAILRDLPGQVLGEAQHRRLRGGVMGAAEDAAAPLAGDRAEGDDAAILLLLHDLAHRLGR